MDELVVVELFVHLSGGIIGRAEVVPTPPITGETVESIEAALRGPIAGAVTGTAIEETAGPSGANAVLEVADVAIAGSSTAKCAFDLAVHDALGAAAGVDLFELLGGEPGRSVSVETDVTISLSTPTEMAAACVARIADGFTVLKLKLGGTVEEDLERVQAAVAQLEAGTRLRLDANQAWTAEGALRLLDELFRRETPVELVEQPVAAADLAAMARVTRSSPYPVLADESVHSLEDLLKVAELRAADQVNVKLAKCGGLRPARRLVEAAQRCEMGLLVGSMLEPSSTVAAAAAMATAWTLAGVHDLDAALWSGVEDGLSYEPPMLRLAPGR
ncbi:MAG: Mandelate racemase/muconate lactonizing protein [Acidimicrobiaceae bacterium]|nr:Mandelate racemase/muconate lactonizing protein [Acidimicrobiaceae bacterium]